MNEYAKRFTQTTLTFRAFITYNKLITSVNSLLSASLRYLRIEATIQ